MAGKTITFGAVGDVGFWKETAQAVADNGFAWPFEKLQADLDRADLLFGNMESIILPPDYPADKIDPAGLVSTFDPTPALMHAGFDFMNLAANHGLDGGTMGLAHTRKLLKASGIATGGVGATARQARKLQVLQCNGLSVGFLCYGEDMNWTLGAGPIAYYEPDQVVQDVKRSKDKVDVLVVSIHADLEFMETPSAPRREAFRRIADAGATIVLGHHPHVPQGIEMRKGRLIAYSLGNCYFAAHSSNYMKIHQPHTAHSFMLLAKVKPGRVLSFERVPFDIAPPPNERPIPMSGAKRAKMLAYLEKLDAKVLDDATVAANWRKIAMEHLDIYLERIRTMPREMVIEDLLGRLTLVAENRSWMNEVLAAVREKWQQRAAQDYPLHRPHYVLRKELGCP